MTTCTKAPPGWKCTREAGHSGPCAPVLADGASFQPIMQVDRFGCVVLSDEDIDKIADRVFQRLKPFAVLVLAPNPNGCFTINAEWMEKRIALGCQALVGPDMPCNRMASDPIHDPNNPAGHEFK